MTAAWIDAYRDSRAGVQPSRSQIGRVSRTAKELLAARNDPVIVLAAARQAGAAGWPTIDTQLARMTAPTGGNGRYQHVPYHGPPNRGERSDGTNVYEEAIR